MIPWKTYLIFAAVLGLVLSVGTAYVLYLKHENSVALTAQATNLREACQKAQKTTQEAQDALQTDHDRIAAKLAAYKLRAPTSCVPFTNSTNLSAGGAGYAGQNAVTSDALYDYASEAESYRSQLVVCEKFIAQERQ